MLTYNSPVFRAVLSVLIPVPDRLALAILYRLLFGRRLDWDRPDTLSAWINVQKVRDCSVLARYADKIDAKAIVAEAVGEDHVIPTLWSGTNPHAIPLESFDGPVIIKTTHGSGGNIIVDGPNAPTAHQISSRLRRRLRRRQGAHLRERFYDLIEPRIIVEPLLTDARGKVPDDLKFHVINGRIAYVEVIHDRYTNLTLSYYDRDWRKLDITYPAYVSHPTGIAVPRHFDEMRRIAEKLAAPFTYVRIDLYATEDGVKFGEFTFMPSGGLAQVNPESLDRQWFSMMGAHSRRGYLAATKTADAPYSEVRVV